jgi:16S rRNA (guanine966-N2)-methyltransferase
MLSMGKKDDMRIIAGKKRGMKLLPPKGSDTRPITDRVKESLFSVLYKYDVIEDGVVADLFCGTGSMGLEALSRGARWVTFVEMDRSAVGLLDRNIEKGGFVDESRVICANAWKIGAPVDEAFGKYGLVFVDPPYKMSYDTSLDSQLGRLLCMLCEQIKDDPIVVVRTSKQAVLLGEYGQLEVIDRRQWGTQAVALLLRRMDEDDEQATGNQGDQAAS